MIPSPQPGGAFLPQLAGGFGPEHSVDVRMILDPTPLFEPFPLPPEDAPPPGSTPPFEPVPQASAHVIASAALIAQTGVVDRCRPFCVAAGARRVALDMLFGEHAALVVSRALAKSGC